MRGCCRWGYLLVFLILPILISSVFAVDAPPTQSEANFQNQTSGVNIHELVTDWRIISVIALMLSVMIAGLAYMMGSAFESSELKAWAQNELVQVFANAIIIITLLACIALVDTTVSLIIYNSGVPPCTGGTSCLQNSAVAYLDDFTNVAKTSAKGVVGDASDAAKAASRRFGVFCTSIYCGYAATTISTSAERVLEQDRDNIIIEDYMNVLSSLEAQKFFVQSICFQICPAIMALGIVARSFYFTRKLGGLLIAIGVGAMFFLPMMYVFDWSTLDFAANGDKAMAEGGAKECPLECDAPAPLAYYSENGVDRSVNSESELHRYFAGMNGKDDTVQGLINGSVERATDISGVDIISCNFIGKDTCPSLCREIPYPYTISQCANADAGTEKNCASMPMACKVTRLVQNPDQDMMNNPNCPAKCKVVAPLKQTCPDACYGTRFDCRVWQRSLQEPAPGGSYTLTWRPLISNQSDTTQWSRCTAAQACTPSENAADSCGYILPEPSLRDCTGCLAVNEEYTYSPPLYVNCADLCTAKVSSLPPPSSLASVGADKLVGAVNIQEISKMMIPAFLLPLFNIVATLVFIKGLSSLLGGDIEIPGLSKVF